MKLYLVAVCSPVATALFLSALVLLAGCQSAEEQSPEATPEADAPQNLDAQIAAALGSSIEERALAELRRNAEKMQKAGALAVKKGGSELMRSFGKRLLRDHRFLEDRIKSMARAKQLSLDQTPQRLRGAEESGEGKEGEQQDAVRLDPLDELQAQAFDQAFLKAMETAHRQAIRTLSEQFVELDDSEVNQLVQDVLQILAQHLALTQHLQRNEEPSAEPSDDQ